MAADLTSAALLFRAGEERNFPLPDRPEVRLGFGDSNEVRLPFEGISRSHARILRDEKGYRLEDAGSANGTFLNGQRVVRSQRLEHLDVIRLGRFHRLIFVRRATPLAPISRRGILNAWLEIVDAGPEQRRDIPRGAITLGRSPAANVHVDSQLVSKLHARIERTSDQLCLTDLQSSNGTFVNGKRIEMQVLANGDEITLGNTRTYTVHIEEGEIPPGEGGVTAASIPGVRFPFPSDWKTKIEWSPDDKAAMEQMYREAEGSVEPAPPAASQAEARPAAVPPAAPASGSPVKPPPAAAASSPPAADPPAPAPVIPIPPAATAGSSVTPSSPAAVAPTAIETVALEGKNGIVTLGLGDHVIGRVPESPLRLEGRSISRRHALLRVRPEGGIVKDLGSANGTFLNGHRLTDSMQVAPGDELKFGELPFIVRFSHSEAPPPSGK